MARSPFSFAVVAEAVAEALSLDDVDAGADRRVLRTRVVELARGAAITASSLAIQDGVITHVVTLNGKPSERAFLSRLLDQLADALGVAGSSEIDASRSEATLVFRCRDREERRLQARIAHFA